MANGAIGIMSPCCFHGQSLVEIYGAATASLSQPKFLEFNHASLFLSSENMFIKVIVGLEMQNNKRPTLIRKSGHTHAKDYQKGLNP